MANSLIEQFKTYKLFKSLSDRAGNVFTTVESYNAFIEQMQICYHNGYSLNDFEFALTLLETIAKENDTQFSATNTGNKLKIEPTTQTEAPVKKDEEEKSVKTADKESQDDSVKTESQSGEEQLEYTDLVARAQDVFPTTQSYNDFISQVDTALQNGEDLSAFDFALKIFETLKAKENSPYYQDELKRISTDPQFSTFATIAENLSVPYAQPLFTATKEISDALENTATLGVDTTIVSTTPTTQSTEALLTGVGKTNKAVLNVDSNGIVSNSEVLLDADGLKNRANVTTNKLEETKMNAIKAKIEGANSESEATIFVDSYNSTLSSSTISPVEMAETFIGNSDIGITSDNPVAQEIEAIAVDSSTASQLENKAEEATKIFDEEIKKLTQSDYQDGPSLEP